ncbi:MAG: M3 family oligoendopeptidase [Planctomycetes bacterium]|nr:M3 family oligoendopeptidase [Planctomycetota bacterium]
MSKTKNYPLTWDLDTLLPHPEKPEFRTILQKFRDELKSLAEQSERLPAVNGDKQYVAQWREFLRNYESIGGQAEDLISFVGCHAAADAENRLFQQLEAELSALGPLREQIATNIEFAFKNAGAEDLQKFVDADDWLGEIRFFLENSRANAQLRLPKEQELLAADLAVDGIHAWGRLYDRISGRLRIPVMERGEIVEKSPGQVQFDSPQRAVRENNFYAADKAWNSIADTCADALNHISGTRLTHYRRLGLEDHLDAPLRHNRMQRETLNAMWSAVCSRKPVLLKYLKKKAELLGLESLTWYDVQAPLPATDVSSNREKLSYDEACRRIIESFSGFSPEFGAFAKTALEQSWVEAEDRPGKRQGGFCTGFPTKRQSRIFMTYTNTIDSMSTLAHELGHAYHSYVLRERPVFLQDYPMNLAETASTFAEAVLGEEQLRGSDSTSEQLVILDTMLADAVSFLMNIHARFLFEDAFHKERPDGELTASRFSELMLEAQKAAYVGGFAEEGWNPNFWISKLHFYISELPFYNFPYTFGYLLSLGVYALADEFGDEFPARYRELLLATGCMNTEAVVQSTFGHDLTDSAFWNKSLDIVESRVERFLELAGV